MKLSAFVWALLAFALALSVPVLIWLAFLVSAPELWRKSARARRLAACRLDLDCPPGYVCYEGRCVGGACSTNADCPPGYVCAEGACVQPA